MTELIIEIPEEEIKFVTEFLKRIGGKVKKQGTVFKIPNAETQKAMAEEDAGKVK